jgi:hypothetical protein
MTQDTVQAAFLRLLPRIHLHAAITFRRIPCPHRRDDAIQETAALAWKWFRRLAERGKDPAAFPAAFATLAARAVASGRRLCRHEPARDALSYFAQQRHHFTAHRLSAVVEEALHDNTLTPVPEQVSFRLDFPAWRNTRSDRDRRILDDLMLGERTSDVADKYGLTRGRISQLRSEFHDDWQRFSALPDEV